MSDYRYIQEDKKYVIYDGDAPLKTPGGHDVTTLYKPLAERIVRDLEKYGYSYRSSSSILAWHFTMIDNFSRLSHEKIEQIMISSFLSKPDWTCTVNRGPAWKKVFGDLATRIPQMKEWLRKASAMQLTAACCIGNAYESLNLAFCLAKIMEQYIGEDRVEKFRDLAQMIADTMEFGPVEGIVNDFQTFDLYYGFHLQEDGPILSTFLEEDEEKDAEEDENYISIEDLIDLEGESVDVETLVGRNFYHYTDGVKDSVQPASFELSDVDLDVPDEENEAGEDEEDEEETELSDYLPDNCWVKRYVDDDDFNTWYLFYIEVDEDGIITDAGCLSERAQSFGFGGFMFMLPGIEMTGAKSYNVEVFTPEKVIEDANRLMNRPSLPLDFSFQDNPLPQAFIEENGYSFALQSAYRLAYTHLSIDTVEDDLIVSFNYSSYQSSGNGYNDMFSRPVCLKDKREEAIDMLLYIFDKYSKDELEQMGII